MILFSIWFKKLNDKTLWRWASYIYIYSLWENIHQGHMVSSLLFFSWRFTLFSQLSFQTHIYTVWLKFTLFSQLSFQIHIYSSGSNFNVLGFNLFSNKLRLNFWLLLFWILDCEFHYFFGFNLVCELQWFRLLLHSVLMLVELSYFGYPMLLKFWFIYMCCISN
jgi:hypothetical protein